MGTGPEDTEDTIHFRREQALDEVRAELAAIREEDLVRMNVDIPGVITGVLGCLPQLMELREQMADQLPRFDIGLLDRLETYALAVAQANVDNLLASQSPGGLTELLAKLSKSRERLIVDARALANRGLVDTSRLAGLRMTQGYRNVAFDVLLLSRFFRLSWSEIEGRTGVSLSEIEEAQLDADRMDELAGQKAWARSRATEANEVRARAWTLFVQKYEQVRRAVAYLRFDHGDADRIAPSPFASRRRAKRGAKEAKPAPAPAAPEQP